MLEEISKNGNVLKSNSNSYADSSIVPYFSAGLELVDKKSGFGLGLSGTVDTNKNFTAGLELSYSFPVGKNKK